MPTFFVTAEADDTNADAMVFLTPHAVFLNPCAVFRKPPPKTGAFADVKSGVAADRAARERTCFRMRTILESARV